MIKTTYTKHWMKCGRLFSMFLAKQLSSMASGNKIYIGTSGWSYKHWAGIYYPAEVKPAKYLAYFSKQFHAAEINSSFYRLPTQKTISNWMAQVPDDFVFCPKMSRYLSHMKKLNDPEEPVARFCGLFAEMTAKMGPVLIQLPENVHFHSELTEEFYQVLKEQRAYRFAMEVRHESWFAYESINLMKKYNISLVLAHSQRFPYFEEVTAKDIYVRFHGPENLYGSSYSNDFLAEYAEKFKNWKAEGHNVWAFFNNDIGGYALKNAEVILEMVSS